MTKRERDTANFTTYEKRIICELTSTKGSIWGVGIAIAVVWFWH
jgi:hypothetical protein